MHHYSVNRGTSFIAAMMYDFCAELYGKGATDHKESEQCWGIFWEISFNTWFIFGHLVHVWENFELVFPVFIYWVDQVFVNVWNVVHLIRRKYWSSFGTRVYFGIIFAPPVIPILLPLYMPYMKRLMVFFNEWRMLPKRAKKPFQTSVNHSLKIRVEFYHDVIMWNASRRKRWKKQES